MSRESYMTGGDVYVVVRDTGDGDGVFVFEDYEDAFAYAVACGGFDTDVTAVPIIDRDLASRMIAEAQEDV
jgi:hypothetical protein